MATPATDKLAVLIDADNAQAAVAIELLAEVARYGTSTVKRAYGDWTTQNLVGWKETLHNLAIQPIQQFRFTVGKNATDSALIIDAMDLLHSGTVDGFCLVSSDSDFTRLATEILRPVAKDSPPPVLPSPAEPLQPPLVQAVAATAREDGWAALSAVGSLVMKANPSFDPRNYGFQKLGELVRAQPYLEVKSVPVGDGSPNVHLFVRRREA